MCVCWFNQEKVRQYVVFGINLSAFSAKQIRCKYEKKIRFNLINAFWFRLNQCLSSIISNAYIVLIFVHWNNSHKTTLGVYSICFHYFCVIFIIFSNEKKNHGLLNVWENKNSRIYSFLSACLIKYLMSALKLNVFVLFRQKSNNKINENDMLMNLATIWMSVP